MLAVFFMLAVFLRLMLAVFFMLAVFLRRRCLHKNTAGTAAIKTPSTISTNTVIKNPSTTFEYNHICLTPLYCNISPVHHVLPTLIGL